MRIQIQQEAERARVVLRGRFDFQSHRDFRVACEAPLAAGEVKAIEIDMNDVEYLDSSALGMLLVLRDKCRSANKIVSLANCRESVKQVLDIANFGKLFAIA